MSIEMRAAVRSRRTWRSKGDTRGSGVAIRQLCIRCFDPQTLPGPMAPRAGKGEEHHSLSRRFRVT